MLKRVLEAVKRERARCSALMLLVCLLLPFAQLAVASTQDPEASLPACCRLHGKHKCFTTVSQRRVDQQSSPAFRNGPVLGEKCGYLPANDGSSFHSASGFSTLRGLRLPQVESKTFLYERTNAFRSTLLRANQKRGPPAIFANS